MSFELFESFKEMSLKEWILWGVMLLLFVALIVFLVRRSKKKPAAAPQKGFDTRALVYGALCMALSFVLSYLRIVRMPQAAPSPSPPCCPSSFTPTGTAPARA